MTKLMLLGSIALLGVPAAALAAPASSAPTVATSSPGLKLGKPSGYQKPLPPFAKVDTNGDHEIEWSEAKAVGVPHAVFKRYDYRHQNKLTMTEWKILQAARIKAGTLPKPGSKGQPPVPESVASKIGASKYSAAAGTSAAPQAVTRTAPPKPSTGG